MAKAKRNWASPAEMTRQVDELREGGLSVKDACKKLGVSWPYYYQAKREMVAGARPAAAGGVAVKPGDLSFADFIRLKSEYETFKKGN